MCIIVDANRLGTFLSDPANEDAAPIRDWLDRRGGRIVYSTGGAFAREVGRQTRAKLFTYVQAGKAQVVSADRYTGDPDLVADFKNKRLVDGPRGKVYSSAANANLLTKAACAAPSRRG